MVRFVAEHQNAVMRGVARFLVAVETNRDVITVLLTALGVLVGAAGVVVALYYARLTRRLAEAAKQQADLTKALFETGHRPWLSILCNHSVSASGQQQAGNSIETYQSQHFVLNLENKGSVPAIIIAWRISAARAGDEPVIRQSEQDLETAIYPGGTERLTSVTFADSWKQQRRFRDSEEGELTLAYEGDEDKQEAAKRTIRLEASVTYRGVVDEPYVTQAVYSVGPDTNFALVCQKVRLDRGC